MTSILKVDNIQNSSGTSAMSIDSSGNVTASGHIKSELPHFVVQAIRPSGGKQAVTGVIDFNNAEINSGNHYDITNNYFQAPVTGLYCFMLNGFACNSSGNPTSGTITVGFETSSDASTWTTARKYYAYTNASAYLPVHTSFIKEMTADDYIRVNVTNLYLYQYATGSEDTATFSGYLIG